LLNEQKIIPGIKVDTGARQLAGTREKITEGLDGLGERLAQYHELGARFAKWRAVIEIGTDIPSRYCLETNAHALARYAALCQAAGIVPIVEPEVLMDGAHTIERCFDVTRRTLHIVFNALYDQDVVLENILLKPNMVISATDCPQQADVEAVARETVRCFRQVVPAAVPGIVFLSGGQSNELATAHLNAMNSIFAEQLPWQLSFSYGRALQQPALQAWQGAKEKIKSAQDALYHRARMNSLACSGAYSSDQEKAA
ncbi:MAG: fructose-bisphosphate aldolase class I, partial [Leptospiraceae bacterium]|nr:fructose-bisphosphate aldolase class I [Leptospiraceae bacterium]